MSCSIGIIRTWLVYPIVILIALLLGYVTAYFLLANDQPTTPLPLKIDEEQIFNLDQNRSLQLLTGTEIKRASLDLREKRNDLLFESRFSDVVPYVLASNVFGIRLTESKRLALAGNKLGDAPWSVGDSLLIESFVDDHVYSTVVIGGYLKLTGYGGNFVSRLGMQAADFGPREITISNLVPTNTNVLPRVTVLYGFGGKRSGNTDLYLIAE